MPARTAPPAAPPPLPRDQFPPGTEACDHCTARCCRYFALPIETPKAPRQFDFMRWYLVHGNCSIFVEDGDWFLTVHGDCEHLLPDHRCGIYETRPDICRNYSNESCEYDGDGRHERLFECAEQLAEYAEAVLPPTKRGVIPPANPPALLPVLTSSLAARTGS